MFVNSKQSMCAFIICSVWAGRGRGGRGSCMTNKGCVKDRWIDAGHIQLWLPVLVIHFINEYSIKISGVSAIHHPNASVLYLKLLDDSWKNRFNLQNIILTLAMKPRSRGWPHHKGCLQRAFQIFYTLKWWISWKTKYRERLAALDANLFFY